MKGFFRVGHLKNGIFCIAVGLLAGLMAFAQEKNSENVVGFFKVDIPAEQNMILAPPMHKAMVVVLTIYIP